MRLLPSLIVLLLGTSPAFADTKIYLAKRLDAHGTVRLEVWSSDTPSTTKDLGDFCIPPGTNMDSIRFNQATSEVIVCDYAPGQDYLAKLGSTEWRSLPAGAVGIYGSVVGFYKGHLAALEQLSPDGNGEGTLLKFGTWAQWDEGRFETLKLGNPLEKASIYGKLASELYEQLNSTKFYWPLIPGGYDWHAMFGSAYGSQFCTIDPSTGYGVVAYTIEKPPYEFLTAYRWVAGRTLLKTIEIEPAKFGHNPVHAVRVVGDLAVFELITGKAKIFDRDGKSVDEVAADAIVDTTDLTVIEPAKH